MIVHGLRWVAEYCHGDRQRSWFSPETLQGLLEVKVTQIEVNHRQLRCER